MKRFSGRPDAFIAQRGDALVLRVGPSASLTLLKPVPTNRWLDLEVRTHWSRQVVLGVHGVLLPEQAEGYFSARYRKMHHFAAALEADALVNVIGTGTMACHSSLLAGLSLEHFEQPGMADLYLANWCHQQQIPMLAIARHTGWLEQLGDPEADSLWAEFAQADPAQAALVRDHRPWGYAAIKDAVDAASARARAADPESTLPERLDALVPALWPCLW